MFFKPVISEQVFNEFMAEDYVVVFFTHESVERFLEFRKAVNPLIWHMISLKYNCYTSVRLGWTTHMKETRGVKVSHGVAFFKRGVLKKELEGYDFEKFKKVLTEFNPNGPDAPAGGKKQPGCCECTIL
ncbi:hypothetical protein H4R18_003023 [Coemansia javaensis]|uniref:Uncharacterized protein n=1 Tax=Coemansia javaensis TaxID=2761396 RepID=A0A9W8LGX9_9FUNG|nr:hypothetical protein H4R18_003023 [Coemansia javaensis]